VCGFIGAMLPSGGRSARRAVGRREASHQQQYTVRWPDRPGLVAIISDDASAVAGADAVLTEPGLGPVLTPRPKGAGTTDRAARYASEREVVA
jgi:hypothetical protein